MNKIVIQGAYIALFFFGTWYVLSQINWMDFLRVEQLTVTTDKKLGEFILDVVQKSDPPCGDSLAIQRVDSLVTRLCDANHIERKSLTFHILMNEEVNAFALPDRHLIVYSGLIAEADSQEVLTGVISHEIAHIELNHVMKKLVNEIGLSVLLSITSGETSAGTVREVTKLLSSTAFDRNMEREADRKATDYLLAAEVNPEALANFMMKLSGKEAGSMEYLKWISTHPRSIERADAILMYSKAKATEFKPILSETGWKELKEQMTGYHKP